MASRTAYLVDPRSGLGGTVMPPQRRSSSDPGEIIRGLQFDPFLGGGGGPVIPPLPPTGTNPMTPTGGTGAGLPPTLGGGGGPIIYNFGPGGPTTGLPGIPGLPSIPGGGQIDLGTLGGIGCNYLPEGALRNACLALTGAPQGGQDPRGQNFNPGSQTCPSGYELKDGRCVTTGIGQYLPGDVGAPDVVWTPVQTALGFGVTPLGVQRVTLDCPPGHVLGTDNICYRKGAIPKQFRKWKPAPKPPMSAADAKALRRISTLQNRVKRLATAAHLSVKRKK